MNSLRRRLPNITIPTLARPRQIDSKRPPLPRKPRSKHKQTRQQHRSRNTAHDNPRDLSRKQLDSARDIESVRPRASPPHRRVGDEMPVVSWQELAAEELDAVGSACEGC
jgi:hypothetical protein